MQFSSYFNHSFSVFSSNSSRCYLTFLLFDIDFTFLFISLNFYASLYFSLRFFVRECNSRNKIYCFYCPSFSETRILCYAPYFLQLSKSYFELYLS